MRTRRLFASFVLALLAIGSSLVLTSGPVRAAGCTLASTGGTVVRTLGARSYRLNVPAGLTGTSVPLVVSLHGNGTGATFHENETGWNAFAASHNFIVAYPEGNAGSLSWNYTQGSADVTFLRNVVADISATWCVDARRVYTEGYSNGAIMAERLACDAADVFASVTAYAGSSPTIPGPSGAGTPCTLSRPVAVGIFQSLFDPVSSYAVGVDNRDGWISRDGCPTTGVTEPGVLYEAIRYAPCNAGVEVVWRVYLASSHNWPSSAADKADILNRMWGLFARNPRP